MNNNNPWEGMEHGVQRKTENSGHKSIYWINDLNGRWGISFRGFKSISKAGSLTKLRGIEVQEGEIGDGTHALNLVLVDKDEWELFLALCHNLISAAVEYDDNDASIEAVKHRLKRWQELLKRGQIRELSIERQMGLLTEVDCLQNIIAPQIGLGEAVTSWVGADFDRQDFLLENAAVEVKSHITSRGEFVKIASKYQLDTIKDRLILTVYSLSLFEQGDTVLDIVERLRAQLRREDYGALERFENKLLECDFVPELIEKPLQGFHIDNRKHYLVADDFPRIRLQEVSPFIYDLKYAIELTYCARFELEEDQLFSDGVEN
jgi:hypothetical protein